MISIKVPTVGESITEVTLLKWTKPEGAWVDRDEVIAELESEKATFEVNAEQAGTLHHKAKEGDSILIGAILADINETATYCIKTPNHLLLVLEARVCLVRKAEHMGCKQHRLG